MYDRNTIGDTINRLRLEKGLTLEEFGKDINKSKSAVSKWINKKNYPKIEDILFLSKYFGVDVKTIMFGIDYQQSLDSYLKLTDSNKKVIDRQIKKLLREQEKHIHSAPEKRQ